MLGPGIGRLEVRRSDSVTHVEDVVFLAEREGGKLCNVYVTYKCAHCVCTCTILLVHVLLELHTYTLYFQH